MVTMNGQRSEYVGTSNDEKPTTDVLENSLFLELDTGDFYYFDGTDWQKVGAGAPEDSEPLSPAE